MCEVFDQCTIENAMPPTSSETVAIVSVRLRRLGDEKKLLTTRTIRGG